MYSGYAPNFEPTRKAVLSEDLYVYVLSKGDLRKRENRLYISRTRRTRETRKMTKARASKTMKTTRKTSDTNKMIKAKTAFRIQI